MRAARLTRFNLPEPSLLAGSPTAYTMRERLNRADTTPRATRTAVDTIWAGIRTAADTTLGATRTVAPFIRAAIRTAVNTIWAGIRTVVDITRARIRTAAPDITLAAIRTAADITPAAIRTAEDTMWAGIRTAADITPAAIRTAEDTMWAGIHPAADITPAGTRTVAGTCTQAIVMRTPIRLIRMRNIIIPRIPGCPMADITDPEATSRSGSVTTMPDSLAADSTDQIHDAANRSDTNEALVWRMDEALVIALDSDDWSDCRRIATQLIGSLQDYEGCYFGLASAAYFIDGDAPSTCKLIQLCLSKPRSKWRPDVYRLLGIALQGAGQHGAAADAFQSARNAVIDLDMAEEDKERYRQWIEDAIAPPMSDQVAADANRGRPDAISEVDEWIEAGIATGDWQKFSDAAGVVSRNPAAADGVLFGKAAFQFYQRHDLNRAEQLANQGLKETKSVWRPHLYRLLGLILIEKGRLEDAESRLDNALDLIEQSSRTEHQKIELVAWVEEIANPLRSRLLEEQRSGIKSVLRNGILTREHSDKRECRQALIALKVNELRWTPDYISTLLFVVRGTSRRRYPGQVRAFLPALFRLVWRTFKLAVMVAVVAVAGHYLSAFLRSECYYFGSGFCTALDRSDAFHAFRFYTTKIFEIIMVALVSLKPVLSGESHDIPALAEDTVYYLVLAIAAVFLLTVFHRMIKILIEMKTTRYAMADGRITVRTGLLNRRQKAYEIIHASQFSVDQGAMQTLLGRAKLSFYTVSVGGHEPELVGLIGRHDFILKLDREIRGLARMLRTLARLKGIVAVD
jgi:tetratricopeptide (TPR) repeat protein/membrane protein YdbS with pleckstrin-like domain